MPRLNSKNIYFNLVQHFAKTINSQQGSKPADERLKDAHTLGTKFFEHAISIFYLSKGIDVSSVLNKEGFIEPISSLYILVRALFENYLTFFYVFIDPKDSDEYEFRYCVWRLTGLTIAEKHVTTIPPPDDIKKHIKVVQEHIERNEKLRERIKSTNEYKTHSTDSQQKAIDGQWRFPAWVEIAKKSGIGPKLSSIIYNILTSHDHSGGLALIQIQNYSLTERSESVKSALHYAIFIIAKMIEDYVKVFPEASTQLDSYPELKRIVHIFSGAVRNMK